MRAPAFFLFMTKPRTRPARTPKEAPRAIESTPGLRRAIVAMAFAAAFLERWWFPSAWHEAGSVASAFYYGDAQRLVAYAIAIAQGQPFDNGIPFHPPGWPILLAGFLKLFGAGSAGFVVPVGAVKMLLAALSAGAVAVATLVAYEAAGFTAMGIVAVLGPFAFGHIVEGTVADTEALYGLCVAIAVYATLRAVDRGAEPSTGRARHGGAAHGRGETGSGSSRASVRDERPALRWTAVAGAVCGYAMLVRAEFLACAVILLGCIVWSRSTLWRRSSDRRTGWPAHLAVFAICYALVLTPTTIWHWQSLRAFNATHVGRVAGPLPEFAPVTSYGPFNFAMANHENADGGPNRDHPMLDLCNAESTGQLVAGQLDLACPAVYDLYVHGYRIGLAWVVSHPLDAASLVWHKLAMTSGFLAQGYLVDDVGAGATGTRRRVDLVDPDSRALLPIHLALLVAGLWILRRRPLTLAIVAAPLVALLASTVLFYGYVRLGTSYLPVVWVFEAAAIAAVVKPKQPRTVVLVVSAIVGVLLLADGLRLGATRTLSLDGARTDAGILMQDETLKITRVD